MTDKLAKLGAVLGALLEHRRLPLALVLGAIVLMLPALHTGLLGDDLIQRLAQLKPAEMPPRIMDTGFVPSDPGKLGTVLCDLFGYLRAEGASASARDYGIAPWWANEAWRAALFRPVTAFTHWLDYRLFPSTPSLMHAHNIAWYAVVVFLAASLYRKIATVPPASNSAHEPSVSGASFNPRWVLWGAGLASCLFVLDKNTYFPVAYVANRGFIVALAFGLLCLHAHFQWRTTRSSAWMVLSALCLLLSLLANEGGASTLAFLVAYALVIEPGEWRQRFASLMPAAMVTLGWRAAYVGWGFGVRNFLLYIDPGYEPWLFLKNLVPRANALLGGQLTGIPPELALCLNTSWRLILALCFAIFILLCAIVFLPVLRRDRVARFWTAAMLLALVPAATVAPLSKNMGFVAVGAFGLLSSFLVRFASPPQRASVAGPLRRLSWFVAVWLVLAHGPGSLMARMGLALASPSIPTMAARACALPHSPDIGERDVVVINDPTVVTAMVPFDRAYRGQPLPRSIRILIPGSTGFEVNRADASTLILKAKEADLFDCPALGPIHISYGCKAANELLLGGRTWKTGDHVRCKGFMAEIRDISPRGQPRRVVFQFDRPLESNDFVWLYFDWRHLTHPPFVLPRVGETVEIRGAGR